MPPVMIGRSSFRLPVETVSTVSTRKLWSRPLLVIRSLFRVRIHWFLASFLFVNWQTAHTSFSLSSGLEMEIWSDSTIIIYKFRAFSTQNSAKFQTCN